MNPYVIGAIIIVSLLVVVGIYKKGESVGYQACEADTQVAVDKEKKRQGQKADELKNVEETKSAEINQKILYVKQKIKPGECLAVNAPDDVLGDLGWVYNKGSKDGR